MEAALALCRFAHFAAAMTLFGATAFVVAFAPPDLARALRLATRGIAAAAIPIAAVSALVWLALEAASMAGDWSALVDPQAIGAVLTDTAFGAVWLWRLVLAAALVVALALGRGGPSLALVVGAALLLASLGLVDHAAMQAGARRRAPSRQRRAASAGDRRRGSAACRCSRFASRPTATRA